MLCLLPLLRYMLRYDRVNRIALWQIEERLASAIASRFVHWGGTELGIHGHCTNLRCRVRSDIARIY